MSPLPLDARRYDLPIEGWCAAEIFYALEVLCRGEDPFTRAGPVCEIGVHHGKFLIGAHNVLGGVRALGIDIFEEQERNVDGSGLGSGEKFREAQTRYAVAPAMIDSMRADSLELTPRDVDEILSRYGRFRVFSIDGGHTAAHLVNDLRFASDVTAQDGLILIDDFFSPHWPGVTEGVFQVLASRSMRFVPFLYVANKLFLTGLSFHERALRYARAVADGLSPRIEFRPVSIAGFGALAGV